MRCRVYTNTMSIAIYLRDYIYKHPALEHFLDWDHKRTKENQTIYPTIYLTNGSSFILGPMRRSLDLGMHYDRYAEYEQSYHVPIDFLLMIIGEVVK